MFFIPEPEFENLRTFLGNKSSLLRNLDENQLTLNDYKNFKNIISSNN